MEADAMDRVLAATQTDLFWLPTGVQRLERPDVLALRDGTRRTLTNNVVRVAPDADVPALVAEIAAWHTGPISQWLVVPTGPMAELERALPTAGYAPSFQADAWTVPSDHPVHPGAVEVRAVADLQGLRDAFRACELAFGRPVEVPEDALPAELAACTGPGARTGRFTAYVDGEPVGSANVNAFPALGFAFLWGGGVVPARRGRGVYRALLDARLRWARENGLPRTGLYANRDTSGPVCAGLGFTRHGPMAYWKRT